MTPFPNTGNLRYWGPFKPPNNPVSQTPSVLFCRMPPTLPLEGIKIVLEWLKWTLSKVDPGGLCMYVCSRTWFSRDQTLQQLQRQGVGMSFGTFGMSHPKRQVDQGVPRFL